MNILIAIAVLLVVINLVSFLLMGADKRRAKQGRRRIPERMLFLWTGLFGALGGVLGMRLFRHKTRHWYFVVGMPAILVLQIAAYLLLRP